MDNSTHNSDDKDIATLMPRLHAEDVEAIALRIADLIGKSPKQTRWLTAAQVAERYCMTTDWVYANADALGASSVGDGPKPRLRFDASRCDAYMESRSRSVAPRPKRRGQIKDRTRNGSPLLRVPASALPVS